ncbi:MAG TPA: hypothetical protein VKU84_10225 [Stellaceae bacterium]|nr:hypothetical protein [Stellaceae bacterium]
MRRWLKGEPTLREVLDDPVIQLMMRRDRVDPDRLHAILRVIGTRLPNVELPPGEQYRGR